jgi:predicted CoA-binding protein
VVAATPSEAAPAVVRAAAARGIPRIWMHRSFGEGGVSAEAVTLSRERGIQVIVGGCPMMYRGPVRDPGAAPPFHGGPQGGYRVD